MTTLHDAAWCSPLLFAALTGRSGHGLAGRSPRIPVSRRRPARPLRPLCLTRAPSVARSWASSVSGRWGGPMADRAAQAGWNPRVFDMRTEAVAPRISCGAVVAASAADAARVPRSLPYGARRRPSARCGRCNLDRLHGPGRDRGPALDPSPWPTAHEARDRCRRRGRHLVDVCVSGGPAGARDGTLVLIAGGDAELLERLHPLFETYGSEVVRCGPVGAGAATKAARNLIALGAMALAADALALAERAGVDRDCLARVVSATRPDRTVRTPARGRPVNRHHVGRGGHHGREGPGRGGCNGR